MTHRVKRIKKNFIILSIGRLGSVFKVTRSICYGIKKIKNRIWELDGDTWDELHQQYKHNGTAPEPHTQDDHDPSADEFYNLFRTHDPL